jgi:hypothetical protein
MSKSMSMSGSGRKTETLLISFAHIIGVWQTCGGVAFTR